MSATPFKPNDMLTIEACRVSRHAPTPWAEFMKAFVDYTRQQEQACIHAPADQVLIMQGRARQCEELLNLLTAQPKQR